MNAPNIRRRGIMLILSSPSGAGKTTLSRLLLERDETLIMSVSCTTRPKRPGETPGIDYHFVGEATFEAMIAQSDMLEHAEVFGNRYGTPRKPVEAALASGRDVLFDIDWQGTQQLKQAARDDVVSVFVLPPSFAELEKRLHSRAQDTPDVVARRMAKASDEMSHWAEYDYIIVNQHIEKSVASVQAILTAERLRRARQVGLRDFVVSLTQV
ncbi:MAG: guanylate kinase [Alphaproteobacteria bacterium]